MGEYWVVDSEGNRVLLFEVVQEGSLLEQSQFLSGMSAGVLGGALRLGREEGRGAVMQCIFDLPE